MSLASIWIGKKKKKKIPYSKYKNKRERNKLNWSDKVNVMMECSDKDTSNLVNPTFNLGFTSKIIE